VGVESRKLAEEIASCQCQDLLDLTTSFAVVARRRIAQLCWAVQFAMAARPPVIEALFLAEFDIERGSTLRHTLPAPLDGYTEEGWFAELMLPEVRW